MKKQNSTYRMRTGAVPRTALLLGLACVLAAPAELLSWQNDAGSPEHAGDLDDPNNHPLITILEPKFEHTYSRERLHARIRLSRDADPETFEAHLNGKDVSIFFSQAAGSEFGPGCDKEAWLPDADLLQGTNVLLINVTGPNQSAGVARVKFEWNSRALNGAPVSRMIPGVAVNALNYIGGDTNNLNNFQIVIGPGPNFPTRVYTAANLTCSAGINSVQVLVLQRKTLDPDQTVPGNTGQACFGDAGSLANFLKSLPTGDLVIANSFFGAMPNLNTTAIGGTDFSNESGVTPLYYNVIGVAGASPGQAYESYQPIHPGVYSISPLIGSLMLDTRQNYFFVPSEYRPVDVIPNDPAYPNTPTTTILYNYEPFRASLPPRVNGGFVFFLIDRQKGGVQSSGGATLFPTNSSDPAQSEKAIRDLTISLTSSSPYYMFFLTTIGVPFSSASQVNDALWHAVNSRGGNGYMMAKLTPPSNGGPIPIYTLISSTDPDYPMSEVIENSNLWTIEQQRGAVHMLLGRNRQNLWSAQAGMSFPASLLNFAWTQVGFQQSRDWPAWTAGKQAAYNDLTSAKNTYPSIGRALGCNQSSSTPCQPIRSYYDGGIGGTGSAPPVVSLDYNGLTYQPNPDYSEQDFNAVRQQLATEQGYLRNIYALYSLFMQLANDPGGNTIQQQLATAVGRIDEGLRQNNDNVKLVADVMVGAATVAGLATLIPGAGPPFGAMHTLLRSASYFVAGSDTGPSVPDEYSVTLQEITEQNARFGADLADTIVTLFTSIVNDWGKLQTIGSGYGAQQAPWYMCPTCQDSNVPRSAIPLMALGAKRGFYSLLLPTIYSTRSTYARTETDATRLVHWYIQYSSDWPYRTCSRYEPYRFAPRDAWWSYTNITQPAKRDFYIISETKTSSNSGGYVVLKYPSGSLLADLFTAPVINNDGSLGGGAGFIKDRVLSGIGKESLIPVILGVGNACSP